MRRSVGTAVLVLLAVTACGQVTSGSASTAGRAIHEAAPAATAAAGPAVHDAATAAPTLRAPTLTPRVRSTAQRPPDQEPENEHLTQPIALPRCRHASPSPHFETVQAMMRYLAAAWNRRDWQRLCHVTNPNARRLLAEMHSEAVNLRLDRCNSSPGGTYICILTHDYPASMHRGRRHGQAFFDAAPADTPGWYMSIFETCG